MKEKENELNEENKMLRQNMVQLQSKGEEINNLEKKIKEIEEEKNKKATQLQFALNQARKWEKVVSNSENEKVDLEEKLEIVKAKNTELSLDVSKYMEEYEGSKKSMKEDRLKMKPVIEKCKRYMQHHKRNEYEKKRIREEMAAFYKETEWDEAKVRAFLEKLKRRVKAAEETSGETGQTLGQNVKGDSPTKSATNDGHSKKQPLASTN